MSFFCADCSGDHYPSCGDRVEPAFFSWLQNKDVESQKLVDHAMGKGDWLVYCSWLGSVEAADKALETVLRAPQDAKPVVAGFRPPNVFGRLICGISEKIKGGHA